jgi:hypothetical protein
MWFWWGSKMERDHYEYLDVDGWILHEVLIQTERKEKVER